MAAPARSGSPRCRWRWPRGARVAATAGTAAKRAFLRAAGAELVLDSRDPGFADALRAALAARAWTSC